MTGRSAARRVRPMPDATTIRLALELSLEAWPEPRGSLRDEAGRVHPFRGFLGFAAALEEAVGTVVPASPQPPHPEV